MRNENLLQAVRRHLRNGYVILTRRGPRALFGAAMLEAAKIVDAPTGPFIALRDLPARGPAFARSRGLRRTAGAVLRQLAAKHDPPLGRRQNPVAPEWRAAPIQYFDPPAAPGPDGLRYARRPLDECDFALETPFRYRAQPQTDRIAAIIHAFHVDTLPEILDRLRHVPVAVDLFISTDTGPKRDDIAALTAKWATGDVDIRIAPNRGRDIAPKLLAFRDVYSRYDVFLHLHTKKSPHAGATLSGWRDHLLDNLIGDPAIAASNLSLFNDPKIGFVFAQHIFAIRGSLHWGFNFDIARALMRRLGVELDERTVLEFPSGSMFWGRSAALRPLLDLELSLAEFPEEAGQLDGTLAHAIERVALMAGETRGFEWLKVVRRDAYPLADAVLPVSAPDDIARHRLRVFQPCLAPPCAATNATSAGSADWRSIAVYPSRNPRARLNLLISALDADQRRLLDFFEALTASLGDDVDSRIVVTETAPTRGALAMLAGYNQVSFAPGLDAERRALVDASGRAGGRLNLRARDLFVAAPPEAAFFCADFERHRARFHGGARAYVEFRESQAGDRDAVGAPAAPEQPLVDDSPRVIVVTAGVAPQGRSRANGQAIRTDDIAALRARLRDALR